jgi:hypothetical protein
MAFAVVATANHWVLDIVAGTIVVMIGLLVARRIERRATKADATLLYCTRVEHRNEMDRRPALRRRTSGRERPRPAPSRAPAAHDGTELMLDQKGRNPRLGELVCRAVANAGSDPGRRQLAALEHRIGRLRIDAISIHERLVDETTIERLRASADVVMAWPVRTLGDARRLTRLGVTGLITDTPEHFGSLGAYELAA